MSPHFHHFFSSNPTWTTGNIISAVLGVIALVSLVVTSILGSLNVKHNKRNLDFAIHESYKNSLSDFYVVLISTLRSELFDLEQEVKRIKLKFKSELDSTASQEEIQAAVFPMSDSVAGTEALRRESGSFVFKTKLDLFASEKIGKATNEWIAEKNIAHRTLEESKIVPVIIQDESLPTHFSDPVVNPIIFQIANQLITELKANLDLLISNVNSELKKFTPVDL